MRRNLLFYLYAVSAKRLPLDQSILIQGRCSWLATFSRMLPKSSTQVGKLEICGGWDLIGLVWIWAWFQPKNSLEPRDAGDLGGGKKVGGGGGRGYVIFSDFPGSLDPDAMYRGLGVRLYLAYKYYTPLKGSVLRSSKQEHWKLFSHRPPPSAITYVVIVHIYNCALSI